MKFYDENENDPLKFYIEDSEFGWTSLNEQDVQTFIVRMDEMLDEARAKYPNILENALFDCQSENYVKLVCQIVKSLQDFNFSEADTTDVHQLVFSNLGNAYQQIKLGQYITPLPIIEFLVDMINPKEDETIVDPTLGLGDFLAQSFNILDRNGKELNDSDLYGIDNDENMIMLAQLNLLLCGAGGVVLRHGDSKLEKFDSNDRLMSLVPSQHKNGKWDNWATRTILKKFDIVMTNPPFGSDRSWKPEEGSAEEKQAEMYQTWNDARNGKSIDMGVIFLENAVRSLRENGRMAIVLSNSIASVATWKKARDWFFKNMRVVATFDLPSAFVDATVRTTLVIAYKPSAIQLKKLQKDDYEFFTKRIEKIGYKVKTISGVTQAVNNYKRDENFEYVIGEDGERIIDSEFNEVYENFYGWAEKQEKKLKEIFLD